MKNLLILLAIPLFFISCVRDNDGSEQNNLVSFDVSMSIPSFGVYGTDKSANSQAAKSSSFEHIFKDEIDVVFTSTTSDFTATLTITPNDLSSSPSIELPYGTYSWTISTENDFTTDLEYSFPDFLPVYGTGTIEVFSSNISLDLIVDTNYGLVTVQKENITKATITLYETMSKQLTLLENLYYTYAYQQDAIRITIEESKYGSTITEPAQGGKQILAKTHYNYILSFSDVDVNSITLKTAAFEQFDYYLQPTGTASCTLSFDVYKDSWVSTQANGILTTTFSPSVEITPILYRLSSTCSSTTLSATITGLPEGLTMTYDSQNVATVSGTPSSQATGTYTYTLTGNITNLNSSTSSVTVQGVFSTISINRNNENCSESLSDDLNTLTVRSNLKKNSNGTGDLDINDFKITFISKGGSVIGGYAIPSVVNIKSSCGNATMYELIGPFEWVSNGYDDSFVPGQNYTINQISDLYLNYFTGVNFSNCSSTNNCELWSVGRIDVYQKGYDVNGNLIDFNRDYSALYKCTGDGDISYSIDENDCN